jgi:hypothetical protein
MSKGSIHDVRQTEARNQLNRSDSRQFSAFAEQSVVGGAFELREITEQIIIIFRKTV